MLAVGHLLAHQLVVFGVLDLLVVHGFHVLLLIQSAERGQISSLHVILEIL